MDRGVGSLKYFLTMSCKLQQYFWTLTRLALRRSNNFDVSQMGNLTITVTLRFPTKWVTLRDSVTHPSDLVIYDDSTNASEYR